MYRETYVQTPNTIEVMCERKATNAVDVELVRTP